jgi:hypothetical protein
MELKAKRSRHRISLIPYGVHGQLRWSDFEYGEKEKPSKAADHDLVEWVLSM